MQPTARIYSLESMEGFTITVGEMCPRYGEVVSDFVINMQQRTIVIKLASGAAVYIANMAFEATLPPVLNAPAAHAKAQ